MELLTFIVLVNLTCILTSMITEHSPRLIGNILLESHSPTVRLQNHFSIHEVYQINSPFGSIGKEMILTMYNFMCDVWIS